MFRVLAWSFLVGLSHGLQVAVIGGGIAGMTTVLEVLDQHPGVGITLFEFSPSLDVSTSALIAASMSFDEQDQFWGSIDRDYKRVVETLIGDSLSGAEAKRLLEWGTRLLAERIRKDKRFDVDFQTQLFHLSLDALKRQVSLHPEQLCSSVIGEWCCDSTPAQDTLIAQDINCSTNNFGLYHVIESQKICDDIVSSGKAPGLGYDVHNAGETISRISDFMKHEDAARVSCSIVDPARSGYTRGEVLLPTLGTFFNSLPNVFLFTGCEVTDLEPIAGGEQIALTLSGSGCPASPATFDRVIVASGANSQHILRKVDPQIFWQILPLFGFLLTGSTQDVPDVPTVSPAQLGLGLQLEDRGENLEAAFIRSTEDRMVRLGGGAQLVSQEKFLPPFPQANANQVRRVFDPLELSRNISNAPHTNHATGARPISYFVNFALIKVYAGQWRHVLLNSGLGFHGYTMSWGASKLVADLLIDRTITDPAFAHAFTLELASEQNETCIKYAPVEPGSLRALGLAAAVGGAVFLAVVITYYSVFACSRRIRLRRARKATSTDGAGATEIVLQQLWIDHHALFGLVLALALFIGLFFPLGWSLDWGLRARCTNTGQCSTNEVCQYGDCVCAEGTCYGYTDLKCRPSLTQIGDDVFHTSFALPVAIVAPIVSVLVLAAYIAVNHKTFFRATGEPESQGKELTNL
eukprot:c9509_g1_i2.p1 GENE.c9509_g1_i2~~c9509_g1_i2.p1  ORF type:complete len:692 (+),score=145.96 c9509_g1_i2:44-2119(+)